MIVTHTREKLIHAVLYFAKTTRYCGKTKLMKLLYFLDFTHFKQTGKAVTELEYFAWPKGPVPKIFFEEISSTLAADLSKLVTIQKIGDFQQITPLPMQKPDLDYFSPREVRLLEEIAIIFRDTKANEISDISHLPNQPWDKTLKEKGALQLIEYFLALDDTKESLPHDIARERHTERLEMYANYGKR